MNVKIIGDTKLPAIVFLHGFTGSAETWNEVSSFLEGKFRIVAVDLTGHGKSGVPESPERYSMEQQVEDLESVFALLSLRRFTLVGYSMGGRIGLAYTVTYPDRVSSLILESASPGLRTEVERQERQLADEKLAKRIGTEGLTSFINFWERIPLFSTQLNLPLTKRMKIRTERLKQSEVGLRNSLIGIGTGSQSSYWNELESIHVPVLLITGEIDIKFVIIAREMKENLKFAQHEIINEVGHAIHVENPTSFATMIEEHINSLKN
ncbi:2-succinyl-6-hydroxy-2,4-cyclohexadiene-1-carboxylate synthase [Sporosarcina sp. CAU 1771]